MRREPPAKRLLIVKTSSMGDVVHNLPVVSDILRAQPEWSIDWVVEEAYAQLPAMHPGVRRVLPVAVRRWRKNWFDATVRCERKAFLHALRSQAYDAVIDTQGLLKSAIIARCASLRGDGWRAGADRFTAREGLASWLYQRRFPVDAQLHAVERLRSLVSQALDYPVSGLPEFGLAVAPSRSPWLPGAGSAPWVVLLHATSRAEKSWPEAHWVELGQWLASQGCVAVLPWGSGAEHQAAEAIAVRIPGACVAPRLDLREAAGVLVGARAVVGVDTGLTHLAAALGVPVVALFGATPRWRFAPYWSPCAVSLGDAGVQPDVAATRAALLGLGVFARHEGNAVATSV